MIVILFSTRDCITIHFGKNPKKGGIPPNESKDKNIKNLVFIFMIVDE